MYDYKAMSIFATVIEQGSMQAAAEKLFMTPSAVTQAIQKLEGHLNIKLLNRTTRKLSLTEAGEVFYQHISKMQQNANEAIKSIELLRAEPSGKLTIACASGLIDSGLSQIFKPILAQYPEFTLDILFEDRVLDLLDKRIDIALRAGEGILANNMIARHLYDFHWKIVAHRDYVSEKGTPQNLAELAQLDWIGFSNSRFENLTFQRHNEHQTITPCYRVQGNSLYASRCLTLDGLGVSLQIATDVEKWLKQGDLVELLPEWQLPTVPLYLVTLQRIQSEKVRIACDLIVNYFEGLKG